MNGAQNRKVHNVEKPFPGCLGRMVNLFDLTGGVNGNKLLTDRPHREASSLSRSQSDVARIASPTLGDQIEDKLIVSDSMRALSNKKINGTPIKMLIDQEMSKEVVSKHNPPPNVVAKLMGLEALPRGDPNLSVERSHRGDYSQHMCDHSGTPFKHWQMDDRYMDKEMLHEVHLNTEQIAYKDIYDIWLQSQRTGNVRDKTQEREKWTEDVNGKKMALIRQKFMEAKRLSTDERLRQSKEFDDALEVLSSNNDLLIRLLDSQNLYELQSTPVAETKRITVLKPSKVVDNEKSVGKGKKNDKQIRKPANVGAAWERYSPGYTPPSQKVDEFPVQPTRIVVLKPSPGKAHEIKAVVSPTMLSPRNLPSGNFYQEPEDDDVLESRKVDSEITQQLHEDMRSNQRDETFYSSVFSNGYTGDESSFNKSDHECNAGNFSDLEVMSPSPRHSWDYINRCGSPFSSSSFSRASCSPESSVCREAKKRLSERWAMMASSKGLQEQRHMRRSSTLGEMLALSDIKKSEISELEGIHKEQEPNESVSCSRNFNAETCMDGSPRSLSRSKSVPTSSTVFDNGLSVEVCDNDAGKIHVSGELTKSKSMKSSFKGKVTSFFFSRSKKPTREKSCLSQSKNEPQSTLIGASDSPLSSSGALRDDVSQSFNSGSIGECSLTAPYESSGKMFSDSISNGQGAIPLESGLTLSKPVVPWISSENQGQPSPISVLEPPFEDDNGANESLGYGKGGHLGSRGPLKSNLIDKSPPIESIARTLSWDDSCVEVASPYPLKPSLGSLDTKVEDQDWLVFVEKLLSAAGIDDQVQSDSFYSRWHSLESPLDPSLRENYANLNEKEPQQLHEAKRRQRRSNQKLVFDCVNFSLIEITGYGSDNYLMGRLWSGSHSRFQVPEGAAHPLVDLVVAQMKELISGAMRSVWGDCGDSNSLGVESVVRKEVVGKGWVELMALEMDILVKEVEGKLLEELVEDAVVDLTGRA
ncbi:uncharacterized protein LOC114163030 [Vigna unguiculata]|uniref:DUF4378 domain-containing protein n=1 Tax=Vigna unguiculata TaxID=3917 RepID=A0A4D6M8T8_VIGUN|nr:uncharacterized protein LOC114163030 [Vigna unguiculata]XP_027902886.1 uncharacterized protein LOC114163030 [Vigna unguiculata]XP_027902893.1 uncharacterized protein LOC114163030 [Vigna unguiculata]QCD97812.1 hypothetical protein DEO72_LG6g2525 [Vigna unguiculata]